MTINDSNQSILKLRPVLVERIWGGTWLKHEFGYQTTSPSIGEAWVISAHKSGDCQIENGLYKGQTLSEVYREHRELFANDQAEKFPLLVKFIDAKEDLSVQVHPGDAYAQAHEHQSGKSEAWIILGALPNSRILIGHNAKNRDELTSMINQQKWNQLLTYRDVAKDEVINIPSGTVHAICAGTTLIEIQQSSDVTYRLYDYDRLDNEGQKRDLHLNKAIDVIDVPHVVVPRKFLPNNPPSNALISVLKTK
ncbi:MAG: mannose-6-phosphate isomerase, partial [Bacteroidia bacterium]|nr:mannose-6-phosphate isomerase [Bacteroidia bacterium]